MATIPVPRSYSQIIGDMIDAFLSRFGLRSLKVGSPVLSILESVAQSQLRSSEDIFTLLEAQSLDNASGDALDRIGADESTPRIPQNPASGTVTITDSSFTKVASKIFQGTPAPIVGSTSINVVDASLYPNTGSVYLGRNTPQFEGPLAYTSKTNNGTYWTLALSTPTLRFHNQGEGVVLAQGGDRQIPAGTVVQTPQGNTAAAVQFKTLFNSTIPDGETSITGVLVVAIVPGISGNVAALAINGWGSGNGPFTGAQVSNPLPLTNGTSVEDDDTYRERIRQATQSRTKGTALAIQTFAVGVTSSDENKRVLSASVVTRQGYPTTLYIDDGTGYEMRAQGVAIESLIDSALGGEQYFKVSQRPIAKAYIQSLNAAPYVLASGMKLSFAVDGVVTEHTFDVDGFRNITNATAYEVVASINADTTLNWQARTAGSGTLVVVTAKADTNESIQLQTVTDGDDANSALLFPAGRVDTMRLYLDDRLLSKDGRTAEALSKPIAEWATMTSPQSLVVKVDGIQLSFDAAQFPKFTDQDFIDANTGFTTLGRNTLDAWAKVFNYRIPGITASVEAGVLVVASNRQHSANGKVQIVSGDLVSNHMFDTQVSLGANSDYTLNRNTGELALQTPLTVGQKLSAGSTQTRAFLQSPSISTLNLAAQANLWLAMDADAAVIPTGVNNGTPLTFTATATAYGFLIKCDAGTAVFQNLLAGDWVVFWDSALGALTGSYRVSAVDTGFQYFYFEKNTTYSGGPITLTSNGIQFCRTSTDLPLQHDTISSGSLYTATSLANALDEELVGALATTYRTNILRVRTNTFSDVNGDIALVAADVEAQKLGLPVANATKNLTGHMASIESGNSLVGTPDFHLARYVTNGGTQDDIVIERLPNEIPDTGLTLYGLRNDDLGLTPLTDTAWGSQFGFTTTLKDAFANASNWEMDIRSTPEQRWMVTDRMMFANGFMLSPSDQFGVLVDGDVTLKRFSIPMWRTFKPTSPTYGVTNDFVDADNGNASLAAAFGLDYSFDDFAVFMAARGKTMAADANRAVLWRYYRLGPDGNNAQVRYSVPQSSNQPVSVVVSNNADTTTEVSITLASGADRTLTNIRGTTRVGWIVPTNAAGMGDATYIVGMSIASGTRAANTPTLTVTLPTGCLDHGWNVADVIYVNSTDINYPSGAYAITARTATTITYSDASASVAAFSGSGTISFDSAGEASLAGGSVVVSDYMFINGPQQPFGSFIPPIYITNVNNQDWSGSIPFSGSALTTVEWGVPLGASTNFRIFANAEQTAAAIVSAVAALDNPIVTGTLVSTGTGIIDRSSEEDAAASPAWTNLVDGINYVKTTTAPGSIAGNYTIVFKNQIDSSLVTNSDWINEIIRVVPRTTENVVEWFNTLAVTGLSSVADIEASSAGTKVQLSSLLPGSTGSIQVQGGGANAASAQVLGTAAQSHNLLLLSVPAANTLALYAGMWVNIDNENVMPKSGVFDAGTNLTSLSTLGVFTFNGAGTKVVTQRSATSNVGLKFEKQGDFVCISDTTFGTNDWVLRSGGPFFTPLVKEGDWINLTLPAAPTSMPQIGDANTGLYRVVHVTAPGWGSSPGSVWIENPNFEPQNVAECDVVFVSPNSVLPGDTIQISTNLWNINNLGSWTVTDVPGLTVGGSLYEFTVDVSQRTPVAVGAVGALGSTDANLVQDIEAHPSHFVKKIVSIAQNATNPSLADLKFSAPQGSEWITAAAGSIITARDKLAFSGDVANGIDGYQYNTGLIKATNQVEYGDPADSGAFPGVVAAGANINIEGAPIKRIQVSIALRARSGANTDLITQSAKSSVAAIINKTGVGQPIALIDIATAAKVPGVISVIMLSPQMITGSDLINVQPFEKPLVLNLDQDILISFVGD